LLLSWFLGNNCPCRTRKSFLNSSRGASQGQAQIFLDRLFSAFGYRVGLKEAGATPEMRVKLVTEDGIQPKPDSEAES